MLDVCHVQTLSRIWHSFDSNGLFSGGFSSACRTLQSKCMTVHENTFVIWGQTKLVSFIVKIDTLDSPQRARLDSNVPLNPERFTFAPCFVYILRGDITCSCLQLAQLFPIVVLKFYSPSLKPVFSTLPNIEVPLKTIGAQCNSNLHGPEWYFYYFLKTESWKSLLDLKWSIWFS